MDMSTELIPLGLTELEHQELIEWKPQGSRKQKNLSNEEKRFMFECLLNSLDKGKLKRGTIKSTAAQFCVNAKTVKRFWEKAIAKATEANDDASERPTKRVGRRRIEIDHDKAVGIDWSSHTSVKSLAKALNMSCSTLHRRLQERAHSFPLNATPLNEIRFQAFSSNVGGETDPADGKAAKFYVNRFRLKINTLGL